MRNFIATLVLIGLTSNAAIAATEGESQAAAFANIYLSLCLKHLNNLEALREKLKPMPKLPPEKAALFLPSDGGDAWPVPDKTGTFVLALPAGKKICSVYVRKVDTEAAKKQFSGLVATAPAPLVVKQVKNDRAGTIANGQTETVAYEWSTPNAPRKMLFILTTASSETAQIQAKGSAALVKQ